MVHRIGTLAAVSCLLLVSTMLAAAATRNSEIKLYPALGDHVGGDSTNRIEMIDDKGLIVEMIVRCGKRAGMITYSKVEKLYCSAGHRCGPSLPAAINATCR